MTDETSHSPSSDGAGEAPNPETLDAEGLDSTVREAQEAIADVRARLAETPAEVVVTNHAMGLYELAAIHLSSTPPRLPDAVLAIDALACLVEGLGDRLGEQAPLLGDALGNIRMAFVQIKNQHAGEGDATDG